MAGTTARPAPLRGSGTEARGRLDPRVTFFDPRVAVLDPRVTVFDPRVAVFDPRVTVLDPRVAVFDPRVTVFDPRVTFLDPRVALSNLRLGFCKPRVRIFTSWVAPSLSLRASLPGRNTNRRRAGISRTARYASAGSLV